MSGTPDDAAVTMIRNLEEKWGKSLAEWIDLVAASKLSKHGEILKLLKDTHGLTHGYANLVAHKAREAAAGGSSDAADPVEAQYGGAKAGLRPIYDKLVEAIGGFGDDLEFAPKKTYVSLRRNKQFGLIQPSTKTRVDVGINLKGEGATERLEKSGSFNAMVSHRVRLSDAGQVDSELLGWLKKAYDRA
jgi:hypothetical protein